MSDKHYDGTMAPMPFHDGNKLVNIPPMAYSFEKKGVRKKTRRKSAETRRVRALLKRLDKEKGCTS